MAGSRHVAFLRAVNVGGRTVKMDHLREIFAALRFANVETFIASGNVLFDTSAADLGALERRIETRLERELGFEVTTFVRSPDDLAAAAAHLPFEVDPIAAGQSLHVGFAKARADADVERRLAELRTKMDAFAAREREIYWWIRGRMNDSLLPVGGVEKRLGIPLTFRSATTVRKLAAKLAPG